MANGEKTKPKRKPGPRRQGKQSPVTPAPSPAVPQATSAQQMRRERDAGLALAALVKREGGVTPTDTELRALERIDRQDDDARRWRHYKTIPKSHWVQMSGRQGKTLNQQAEAYGIPFGGPVVDLPAVAKALSDFLARNYHVLARGNGNDDPLMSGDDSKSDALEKYRHERYLLAKMDRLERERTLLPREAVHEALGRMAAILRQAGDALQRQCGKDAHAILEAALDDFDREMKATFLNDEREGDNTTDH